MKLTAIELKYIKIDLEDKLSNILEKISATDKVELTGKDIHLKTTDSLLDIAKEYRDKIVIISNTSIERGKKIKRKIVTDGKISIHFNIGSFGSSIGHITIFIKEFTEEDKKSILLYMDEQPFVIYEELLQLKILNSNQNNEVKIENMQFIYLPDRVITIPTNRINFILF